jgi:hypothetical protein
MRAPFHPVWSSQTSYRATATLVTALMLLMIAVVPAFASHPEVSLQGSNFEIDTDANLKVDDPAPSIDWANVSEARQADLASGQGDDSFGQGTKEDTAVPTVVSGSIPPNKSDLKTFGVYVEDQVTTDFLHLFWSRVQDPSGTTNMDFEFNQSTAVSSNGVTPVRTAGDLLIMYDLARGGTTPELFLSTWLTDASQGTCEASNTYPCWGARVDLAEGTEATGSINTSPIPEGESDGLGALSARTFGEASIDLSQIFGEECVSFGGAYLKSRSSDSFTAALKDFIAPTPVEIRNCGAVEIAKSDDGGNPLAGAEFTLYVDDGDDAFEPGTDDPVATDSDGDPLTCTTDTTGVCSIVNVFQGSYWIDETVVPDGVNKADGLPQKISIQAAETLKLSFENPRRRGSILVAKVDGNGDPLPGAQFALDEDGDPDTTGDQTPIPTVEGQTGLFCVDDLLFGDYNVVETQVPDGYTPQTEVQAFTVDSESTCAGRTGDPVDDPDLIFVNARNPGAILITKTAKDVNAESGDSPLAGVEFTVTNSDGNEVAGSPVTTGANGQACIDGLVVGDTYTVTETAVPAGFVVDPTVTADVLVTNDAECGSGDEDTAGPFSNDPLSEIDVIFRSLAQNSDGEDRTAATIDCDGLTATVPDETPNAFDDASETFTDLKEGTYTCTVVIDP